LFDKIEFGIYLTWSRLEIFGTEIWYLNRIVTLLWYDDSMCCWSGLKCPQSVGHVRILTIVWKVFDTPKTYIYEEIMKLYLIWFLFDND